MKPLFEDEAIRKVGHDLKFETIVLARHGITLRGLAFDSMLASYLLDATRPGHPLEQTSLEHLSYQPLTEEDVCGRGAKAVPFAQLPDTIVGAPITKRFSCSNVRPHESTTPVDASFPIRQPPAG